MAYVATANSGIDSFVTSRANTKPGSVATGDIAIFYLGRWDSGASFPAVTPPSGAVLLDTYAVGSQAQLLVYAKYVQAGDATYTFSWTGSRWGALWSTYFSGRAQGLTLSALVRSGTTGSSGTIASRTVTATAGDDLAWGVGNHMYSGGETHTPPTSFTEVFDAEHGSAAHRVNVGAGSQTASGGTISASQDFGVHLVALPVAGGGTTPVGKDLGLVWNTRAAVGDTIQALWNTRAAVGDPLQVVWNVRSSIGDPLALVWNVRQAIGDSIQLVWNVQSPLTAVGKDLSLVWNVRALAGDSLQLLWDTKTIAGDSVALVWDVRASIGDPIVLLWNTRALASDELSLLWGVRTSIGDPLALVWHTRIVAGDQVQFLWNAKAAVGDTLSLLWDVQIIGAVAVGKSLGIVWNVKTIANDDLVLRWNAREPTGDDLTLRWDVRSIIGDSVELRWGIRIPVGKSGEYLWAIRAAVGSPLVLLWDTEGVAFLSIADPVSSLVPNTANAAVRTTATATIRPNKAEAEIL